MFEHVHKERDCVFDREHVNERKCVHVKERERERERVCVCVSMYVTDRERVCVCVRERERVGT